MIYEWCGIFFGRCIVDGFWVRCVLVVGKMFVLCFRFLFWKI